MDGFTQWERESDLFTKCLGQAAFSTREQSTIVIRLKIYICMIVFYQDI